MAARKISEVAGPMLADPEETVDKQPTTVLDMINAAIEDLTSNLNEIEAEIQRL